jgi:putative resolvase
LKNQRRVLEDFCAARGVANVEFVEEVGGGLNLKRPKFVALIDRIEARQVSHLVTGRYRGLAPQPCERRTDEGYTCRMPNKQHQPRN